LLLIFVSGAEDKKIFLRILAKKLHSALYKTPFFC
jgi:hypothetical protein